MSELSVKGLTVCTPEFHKIAKRGEDEYAQQEKVDLIVDSLDDIDIPTDKQSRQLFRAFGIE